MNRKEPKMLKLTKTTKKTFAADPFNLDPAGLPITSEVVKTSEFVFVDETDAVDFCALHLGMDPMRAARVLNRKCEFTADESYDENANLDEDGNLVVWKFSR